MSKLTLTDITAGYVLTSTLNANNALIEAALENTLSRDGTSPNTMSANIDMNSNRVVNLADAVNAQDAVTLSQLEAVTGQNVVGFLTAISQDTSPELGGNLSTDVWDINIAAGSQINFTTGGSTGGLYHDGTDLLMQSGDGDITLTSAADINLNSTWNYVSGDTRIADNKTLGFGNGTGAADFDVEFRFIGAPTNKFVLVTSSAVADRPFEIDESISVVTINTKLDMNFNEVSYPRLTSYSVTSTSPTISSGAIAFNLNLSNSFQVSLTENITAITLSNANSSSFIMNECIIKFVQDATGSRTVAGWPASVKWATGSAPVITTTATTGTDIIVLRTWDGGTTWFGDYSQDYS